MARYSLGATSGCLYGLHACCTYCATSQARQSPAAPRPKALESPDPFLQGQSECIFCLSLDYPSYKRHGVSRGLARRQTRLLLAGEGEFGDVQLACIDISSKELNNPAPKRCWNPLACRPSLSHLAAPGRDRSAAAPLASAACSFPQHVNMQVLKFE